MIIVLLLAIVLSTWGVLAVGGMPVMLHLTPERQELVLPGLPVLGAMLLVVVTHWPAMFLPTPAALIVSAIVLAVIAAAGWLRGGRLHVTRRRILVLASALVLGAIPASLALLPALELDRPRLVQPTSNNDAFAYVTLSSWLRENPALEVPSVVSDPPVYGYVRTHLTLGLRLGEELLHVGAAILNGRDVASTWFAVMASWVLMLPGAFWVAIRMLRLPSWMGVIGGFAAGTSAVLISQVYNQNSAAVLGVVMAPVVVVAIAQALDGDRWPRWFPALGLAALAGTYTELLPVLFPGVALFVLARHPRHYPAVLVRGIMLLGISVAVSPFIWRNVVRSLLLESGFTAPGVTSSFIHAPGWTILNRLVGATSIDGSTFSHRGLLLLGVVVLGLVGAAIDRSLRRFLLPTIAGAIIVAVYLTFVHRFPYGQQRAVQVTVPLVVLTAAAGAGRLIALLWNTCSRLASAPLAALLVLPLAVAGAGFPLANVSSTLQWERAFNPAERSVDRSLLEGVDWVQDLDAGGADTMIVSSNFFEQLWLTYELRHQEGLAWPLLYPDYMSVDRYERWDGRLRRYALVGRDDHVDVDPAVIVRENRRFRLLDFSRGEGLIATPSRNWGGGERTPDGVAHWMGDAGEIVVIRSEGAPDSIFVEGGAMSDLAPLPISVSTLEGEPVADLTALADLTEHRLPLPDRAAVRLVFVNGKDARPPSAGEDPRFLSFYLSDVRRG